MKGQILSIFYFITIVCTQNFLQVSETLSKSYFTKANDKNKLTGFNNNITPIEEIQPGMGYSFDTQSLAKAVCYRTETLNRSGQSSQLRFEESIDYKTFIKTFNLDIEIKGGYGIFSTNDFFKYLHCIEDDSYSLSINYFQKVSQNVMMTFSYNPETILTDVGKSLYDSGSNPMFRLLCGDTLITSYEEGAILIFSFRINFSSKEEKNEFTTKVGFNIGSFIDASTTIGTAASKYNLSGRIEIQAMQVGGDPTQLSKMLASSIIDCDVRNIKACQETSKNLINYVSNVFPTQFLKDSHGIWLSPLVPLFKFKRDYLVSDFGLKLAASYVTKDVENARKDLLSIKKKLDYYYSNLSRMIQMYATKLEQEFFDYQHVLENKISILTDGDYANGRAIDCFVFPFKCLVIYEELVSKIEKDYEISLMKFINDVQFYSDFEFSFSRYECLPKDFEWSESWKLHMSVYPIGNSKYKIVNNPTQFKYVQNEVSNIGNFDFQMNHEVISYAIYVSTQNLAEDAFTSVFRCKAGSNIDQKFKLKGSKKENPFYFGFYVE